MLDKPEKDRDVLPRALSRLGWLSTYTRQFVAARQLLRGLGELRHSDFVQDEEFLLQLLRAAIFGVSGASSRASDVFSAPYEPSDYPTTHFLSFFRSHRLFSYGCNQINMEELYIEFRKGSDHLSVSEESGLAAETLIKEIEAVRKGVRLDDKSIGDSNCDGQFKLPVWLGASTKAEDNTLKLFADLSSGEQPTWEFWERWYRGLADGEPMDRELQLTVALIPDEIWMDGPEAVSEKIREIEEDYWASALPQHEIIERDPADGKFVVRSVEAEDTVESWLAQIKFALSLAIDSNTSDFNRMCTAFKYLDHTLTNCRDDPNAIEQQVGIARHIIDENIARSDYVSDDSLNALSRVLEQIQVQMRADHPEVRKAWEKRIAQKLREVDRDTKLRAAEAIRAETLRTKDRAEIEMRLDAETVESEQPVEAQAIALRRAGGRAAKMNAIDRASDAVHNVDKSAGFKAVRIGTTGYTVGDIVWMLTDLLKLGN